MYASDEHRRVTAVDGGLGICNLLGCYLFGSEDSRMADTQIHVFRVSLSPKIYRDFEIPSAKMRKKRGLFSIRAGTCTLPIKLVGAIPSMHGKG
jgi:hypothetical protein